MELKKLAPWNWFHKEDEKSSNIPIINRDVPSTVLPSTVLSSSTGLSPLLQLHREIDHVFDQAFRGFGIPDFSFPQRALLNELTLLKPQLDIKETEETYVISVEVAGIDKKDLHLTIDNGTLHIQGEKHQETKSDKDNYHHVERSYGSFERILSLPTNTDQSSIDAAFKNGVLTITLMKTTPTETQGKSISIKDG